MSTKTEVSGLVDHFFRNEFGKVTAILTNRFGADMLELAEDAVQEALYKAMQTWPYRSVPDNPTAWILKVAGNKILDQLRKSQKINSSGEVPDHQLVELDTLSDEAFKDDVIRMMFACCNPKLSPEYQLILTLKILGGLSIREIASALLRKQETVAKSYTRAKKKFRSENISLELPGTTDIDMRLNRVLQVIYLLFNEGYKSTESSEVIRKDLCLEAIRLGELLLENEATNTPKIRGLLSLMYFHSSRFDSRINQDGDLISLENQDRSKWSKDFINRGNYFLSTISDEEANEYFLQAAISGVHCNAKSYNETRWDIILHLYDLLYQKTKNPLIALNRIVPLQKVKGAETAWQALKSIENDPALKGNYLLPAFKAEILSIMGKKEAAHKEMKMAISLTNNEKDKNFLALKLTSL